MGEAKRKKQAAQALSGKLPDAARLELWSRAMQRVVGALTDLHGADCIMYAEVGSRMLHELGYPARPVFGSAAWRIGPGAGDVISHAIEMTGQTSTVLMPPGANSMDSMGMATAQAGMFHAWIEVADNYIVDFTTAQLRDKARQLDLADGGNTQVDWAPPALWIEKTSLKSFHEVAQAYASGLCGYRERADITAYVAKLAKEQPDIDYDGPAAAVMVALRALEAGTDIRVTGVGADGSFQTLEDARQASMVRKRTPMTPKPR